MGPGKGPFLMPEQFTLDQTGIERCDVDVDERLLCAIAGVVYAFRNEFFARTRLAGDEDAQVQACGNLYISPDSTHHIRFADEFADYRRAFFALRLPTLGMRLSSGQDPDPMRGQMSGVFKFAYWHAVQRFEEFHDKLSLPAFDAGFDFIDFPDHGHIVRGFEFAFQFAAIDPDTVKMNSLLRSDLRQILQRLFDSRALRQPETQAGAVWAIFSVRETMGHSWPLSSSD